MDNYNRLNLVSSQVYKTWKKQHLATFMDNKFLEKHQENTIVSLKSS